MQRADRFEHLFKALRKHYKPVPPITDRKVLDHLLYACCLQDATYEAADEAFAKLQQAYFDSNEVRVTTTAELSESLTSLPQANAAANRIKKSLQSIFESRYSFDIDDLKKSNLGKAVEEIAKWQGVTKFVVAYVTQHAFGGHSIPIDDSTLQVCHLLDFLSYPEIEKGVLPGVERAIAKNKGLEFGSLLHQFAVDHAASHRNPQVVAVFKELGMTSKPKAPPPPPPPPPKAAKIAASAKPADGKGVGKGTKGKTAAVEPSVGSKAKSVTASAPSKEAAAAKSGRPSKMAPPPSVKSGKAGTPTKPAPSAGKGESGKKDKAKATPKTKAKSSEKPQGKKPVKVEAKKSTTKKGAASSSKGAAKRSAPAPKKLPVKPVTKKRTKPR